MFNWFRAAKWFFQNAKYARVFGHIIVDLNILGDFVNLGKFPVGST